MSSPAKTVLFFQRGDYARAFRAAGDGVPETYRDQYTSVRYVAALSDRYNVVVVSSGDDPHDIQITPRLRSVRVLRRKGILPDIVSVLSNLSPDLMVVRSPYLPVLKYAQDRDVPCLPCFADIFTARTGLRGLIDRWRLSRLRRSLMGQNITCLSNHSLNASRSMVQTLNLPADRIVPWDWSRVTPEPEAKPAPAAPVTAFYAGLISEAKGVGDCLEAVALLKTQGLQIKLDLAGYGKPNSPLDAWKARADRMGLTNEITFLGLIPNADVRSHMASRDMVLVPSRASYNEGLPNTIYEALASRSPLVISDHPAFRERLVPDEECVQFTNGDPADLAQAIRRLVEAPEMYERLSQTAPTALENLYVGLEWSVLIDRFLADPSNGTGWVEQNALTTLTP